MDGVGLYYLNKGKQDDGVCPYQVEGFQSVMCTECETQVNKL